MAPVKATFHVSQTKNSFFWFTSIGVLRDPSRLKYRLLRYFFTRKPCTKEVPEMDYLTQQKQYLKRTTLCRLKIPLQSICRGRSALSLERSVSKKAVIWQATINLYSRVGNSFGDSILGLYCVAWLTQESVSSRIFVRKKGKNNVQSNGHSQQTLSAEGGKGKSQR